MRNVRRQSIRDPNASSFSHRSSEKQLDRVQGSSRRKKIRQPILRICKFLISERGTPIDSDLELVSSVDFATLFCFGLDAVGRAAVHGDQGSFCDAVELSLNLFELLKIETEELNFAADSTFEMVNACPRWRPLFMYGY